MSGVRTRTAPSPQPAAKNLPSVENRTQNTSDGQSLEITHKEKKNLKILSPHQDDGIQKHNGYHSSLFSQK